MGTPPPATDASPGAMLDRARAAYLGLALGDAYGRPLEFLLLPEVRSTPVAIRAGLFHWTDDTHMSLYLGRAVEDQGPGPLDEDRFGRAVGRRFAEWAADPLTPSTAPGNTCLRGARAFARHGDWQRSGDRSSDGCGSVMRVAPIALGFAGPELANAARISSIVTHAHPNAVEAAIAGAWLCREAVQHGRFDDQLVARAVGHLRREWAWGGEVAEALEAALDLAQQPGHDWLLEEAIPPGDGGWRAASALGLAVAAALRWGPEGFPTAVDRAARIEGDSDSVAALAGMLLGAAGGLSVLPATWLEVLPERQDIAQQAERLWARSLPATVLAQEVDEDPEETEAPTLAPEPAAPEPAAPAPEPAAPAPEAFAPRAPVQLDLSGQPLPQAEPRPPAPASLPAGPRGSLDDPFRVRWLDLGLAGARAPRGRIGLCAAPGRRDGHGQDRTLGVDLDRLVALHEVDHLLLLIDEVEAAALGIADLAVEAEARRIVVLGLPLAPGAAPRTEAAAVAVGQVLAIARAGRRVVLVGREGEERPGTLAAAVLVELGLPPEAALRQVRALAGPRAAASEAQRAFVLGLLPRVRKPL